MNLNSTSIGEQRSAVAGLGPRTQGAHEVTMGHKAHGEGTRRYQATVSRIQLGTVSVRPQSVR